MIATFLIHNFEHGTSYVIHDEEATAFPGKSLKKWFYFVVHEQLIVYRRGPLDQNTGPFR
jgi:hypothetical protein